jgi:hypothetical protein
MPANSELEKLCWLLLPPKTPGFCTTGGGNIAALLFLGGRGLSGGSIIFWWNGWGKRWCLKMVLKRVIIFGENIFGDINRIFPKQKMNCYAFITRPLGGVGAVAAAAVETAPLSRSCLRSRRMKASFFFIALKYWVFSGK